MYINIRAINNYILYQQYMLTYIYELLPRVYVVKIEDMKSRLIRIIHGNNIVYRNLL